MPPVMGTCALGRRSFVAAVAAATLPATMGRRLLASNAASTRSDRVTVTVWTWQTAAEAEALSSLAASFNTMQEDIEVLISQRPPVHSVFQLINSLRSGNGPDIAVFGRAVLSERAAFDIIEDLSPILKATAPDIDIDRHFLQCAAREVRSAERILGIPLDVEVRILAFDRAALTEEGLHGSDLDPANGAITFDRLAEIAHQLDRRNSLGHYQRVGFVPFLGEGTPNTYFHAWQASYFDPTTCGFTFDREEVRNAMTWVRDACERADSQQLLELVQRGDGLPTSTGLELVEGRVAFALVRDWELTRIQALDPEFDLGATFIPVPYPSIPSTSWTTGNALSLVKGTSYPEEACRFLAYAASLEAQQSYSLQVDRLSSRNDVSSEVLHQLNRPGFILDHVIPNAVPSPPVPIATELNVDLVATWSDVIMGYTSVESGLEQLQDRSSEALAASGHCSQSS